MSEDHSSKLNNAQKKQGGKSQGNDNRVEFRVPKNRRRIYESVAALYWENGSIAKPDVSELARLALDILAADYQDKEETTAQKLKAVIPIVNYDKLVLELADTKAMLAAEKRLNSRYEKLIETQIETIKTQSKALAYTSVALQKERVEKELRQRSFTESKRGEQSQGTMSENKFYDVAEQGSNPPTEYDLPRESGNLSNRGVVRCTKPDNFVSLNILLN